MEIPEWDTLCQAGGVKEGFLEMTMPALRPEGDKPGLESRRYGRLALEGCWAVLGK